MERSIAVVALESARAKAYRVLEHGIGGAEANDGIRAAERALAAGDKQKATARFAEVASLARTATAQQSEPEDRPTVSRRQRQCFSELTSCCAYCGAESPRQFEWVDCSRCRMVHYCSYECQGQGWACGHISSCGTPLPTPASVDAGSSDAAGVVLKEFGPASADLTVRCLQRLVHALDERPPSTSVLTATYYPPSVVGGAGVRDVARPRTRRPVTLDRLRADVEAATPAAVAQVAHPEVQRLMSKLITLVCEHGGRAFVLERGAVGLIVRALAAHPSDRPGSSVLGLHHEALRALEAISLGDSDEVLAALLETTRVIESIAATEEAAAAEPLPKKAISKEVDALLLYQAGGAALTSASAAAAAAAASAVSVTAAAAAMAPPPVSGAAAGAERAKSRNALDAVIGVMRLHPTLLVTQRAGLAILRRAATGWSAHPVHGGRGVAAVRAAGSLGATLAAMHRHPADATLASHATAVLHAFVVLCTPREGEQNGAAADEVLHFPGSVEALVAAMRLHGVKEDVQRRGGLALLALAALSESALLHVFGCAGARTALIGALRHAPEFGKALAALQGGARHFEFKDAPFQASAIYRGVPRTDAFGEALPRMPITSAGSPRDTHRDTHRDFTSAGSPRAASGAPSRYTSRYTRASFATAVPATASSVLLALGADVAARPRADEPRHRAADARSWQPLRGGTSAASSAAPAAAAAEDTHAPASSPSPSSSSALGEQLAGRRLHQLSASERREIENGWSHGEEAIREQMKLTREATLLQKRSEKGSWRGGETVLEHIWSARLAGGSPGGSPARAAGGGGGAAAAAAAVAAVAPPAAPAPAPAPAPASSAVGARQPTPRGFLQQWRTPVHAAAPPPAPRPKTAATPRTIVVLSSRGWNSRSMTPQAPSTNGPTTRPLTARLVQEHVRLMDEHGIPVSTDVVYRYRPV
eukprot:jgi/Chrpa1/5501/Chrysochromulina_OHIO_Genome00020967-RA